MTHRPFGYHYIVLCLLCSLSLVGVFGGRATEAAAAPTAGRLRLAPDWIGESNQAFTVYGHAVGTAGDVNGDGYDDAIVGADFYDNGQTDEGRAYVYHGGPGGLSLTANWIAEGNQEEAFFGRSAGTAGDVNGDGYDDVIIGATYYSNGETDEGRAYVYHGGPGGLNTTPDWTTESNQASAHYGRAVGTAGDVNGDGYDDVIVAAHSYDGGQTDEGRAFVYHGGPGGLSTTANWTGESDQVNARYGRAVNRAGDVNNDGYDDVMVGAYWYDGGQTNEGRVYVYHGSAGGLSTTANWTAEPDHAFAEMGHSAATAGDVNNDGYDDVVVGAEFYDNGPTDEGWAFAYYGGPAGLSQTANWSAQGNQFDAQFAHSVGPAGDVNADGYDDVVVGAWRFDNPQADEGGALLFLGSAAGLRSTPAWGDDSDQAGGEYGVYVFTAGDVNADGFDDFMVGAARYSNGQTEEGRAYAYYGRAVGLAGPYLAVAP